MSRKGKSRRRRYGEVGREDVRGILLTQRVILDTKSRSNVSIPPASNFSRRAILVIPTARALLSRRLKVIDIRRHASELAVMQGKPHGSRLLKGFTLGSSTATPHGQGSDAWSPCWRSHTDALSTVPVLLALPQRGCKEKGAGKSAFFRCNALQDEKSVWRLDVRIDSSSEHDQI